MTYPTIDCCPVPPQVKLRLQQLKDASGCEFQSVYRGQDARRELNACGKHDQAWLYEHQGRPEQPNPANPPGQSTHECRSDGIAYRGPRGRKLAPWQVGMDVRDSDVQNVIKAASELGYVAFRPYPADPREYHHVNFAREPRLLPTLQRGRRHGYVLLLGLYLYRLGYLPHRWGITFDRAIERAVNRFQRDHGLKVDGHAGPQTWKALQIARRRQRKGLHPAHQPPYREHR